VLCCQQSSKQRSIADGQTVLFAMDRRGDPNKGKAPLDQRLPFRRRSPRSHSAAGFHVNGYPDPRGALYNPTRLQTHYYLEDEHDRIQQPSTPDLQQWMRLSSKWNKQK